MRGMIGKTQVVHRVHTKLKLTIVITSKEDCSLTILILDELTKTEEDSLQEDFSNEKKQEGEN